MTGSEKRRSQAALTLAIAFVVAACAAEGAPEASDGGSSSRPAPTRAADVVPSESAHDVTGEVPSGLLDEIRAEAAERLGVPVEDIAVRRAEAVVWNDGSLGCPVPGEMYTQALEPGYHVIIEAGDEQLDYRATERGFVKLCEAEGPPFGG